jgi:hypothetical protein
MSLHDLVPVLQLSIGPVILFSGVGLLLVVMTNRYGRVIDRCRTLANLLRNQEINKAYRDGVRSQLQVLLRRARLARLAIGLAALSILLAALLIITLFLMILLGLEAVLLIIGLFIACMLCLVAALVAFILDINISLAALKLEIGLGKDTGE